MASAIVIPPELVEQFADGHGLIWLGAGCSTGSGLPSWDGLIKNMMQRLMADRGMAEYELRSGLTFLEVAQLFKQHVGEHYYYSFLRNEIAGRTKATISAAENKTLAAVADLINHFWPKPGISVVTTNYDSLLEDYLLTNHAKKSRAIVTKEDIATFDTSRDLAILKPNGDINYPDSLVLTLQDYCEYRLRKPQFFSTLSSMVSNSTVLFVGYGLNDFTFNSMLGEVRCSLAPLKRRAFMIAKGPEKARKEVLRSIGVEVLPVSEFDEIPLLLRAVAQRETTVEAVVQRIARLPNRIHESFARSTFLVVDDEAYVPEHVKSIFEYHGWPGFTGSSDPTDALRLINEQSFDFIITDYAMPKVSGGELVKAARASKLNGRAIIAFWSGYDDNGKCVEFGADHFFHKPMMFDELLHTLYKLRRIKSGEYIESNVQPQPKTQKEGKAAIKKSKSKR